MYNHNKAQQSKHRVHISWDILYMYEYEAPSCMDTPLFANAWLSMCSTWGLRMSSACFCAVRPPWMSTKSSLQSLLTLPLAGSATVREILDFIGPGAGRLKMPYTVLRGIQRRLEITGALIPFPLRAITLQRCRIVVRGIFRAISKALHVLPSHTQRRF